MANTAKIVKSVKGIRQDNLKKENGSKLDRCGMGEKADQIVSKQNKKDMEKNGKRKTVAVFLSRIYSSMVRDTEKGLTEAALKAGIKLIFFTSFSDEFSYKDYPQMEFYDKGDLATLSLPDLDSFDGIVYMGAVFPAGHVEWLEKVLQQTKTPVMNIGKEIPGTYTLLNDEQVSYGKILEHLIIDHGCKEIFHVAGRKEAYFTQDRIVAYQNVMRKYGLKCDEDRIFYGSLWMDCGMDAVESILEKYKDVPGRTLPDAIVCANDYTAIGVVDALKEKGFQVPGDVLVTGYDAVEESQLGYPTITTASQPFYEQGIASIENLLKIWRGEPVDHIILTVGGLIKGQSCGCDSLMNFKGRTIRERYVASINEMEYLARSTTNLIIGLSSVDTLKKCFEVLEDNLRLDTGFTSAALCLADTWDKHKSVTDENFDIREQQMSVVLGLYRDQPVERCVLKKGEIIPKEFFEGPEPFYVFPIHYLDYFMGYLVVEADVMHNNQQIVKSWLVNLGSMLENWRIRQELRKAVEHLEKLYNKDTLTGLYNRRGYELFFTEYYHSCQKEQTGLAVFMIDMDGMKQINDSYGHAEGDYSLCVIAEAMKAASGKDEICVRTGGDEFVVLAKGYDEQAVKDFIRRFRVNMSRHIARDKKEFHVSVSVGCYMRVPAEGEDRKRTVEDISEEFLKKADVEMYKEKKIHKKNKAAMKKRN